jgi:hypothetical protein
MTDDLNIFMRAKDQVNTTLNVSTILSVWYALNFQNYFDKSNDPFPEFEMVHVKSDFKGHAGQKLAIYEEKCTKPMTEAEGYIDEKFIFSSQCLSSEMNKTLSLLRQVFKKNF